MKHIQTVVTTPPGFILVYSQVKVELKYKTQGNLFSFGHTHE